MTNICCWEFWHEKRDVGADCICTEEPVKLAMRHYNSHKSPKQRNVGSWTVKKEGLQSALSFFPSPNCIPVTPTYTKGTALMWEMCTQAAQNHSALTWRVGYVGMEEGWERQAGREGRSKLWQVDPKVQKCHWMESLREFTMHECIFLKFLESLPKSSQPKQTYFCHVENTTTYQNVMELACPYGNTMARKLFTNKKLKLTQFQTTSVLQIQTSRAAGSYTRWLHPWYCWSRSLSD